jgi:hypothetical protein
LASVVAFLLAHTREHIDRATWFLKITRRTGMNLNNVTDLHVDAFRHIEHFRRFLFVWATTALDSSSSDASIINISFTDARSLERPYDELR